MISNSRLIIWNDIKTKQILVEGFSDDMQPGNTDGRLRTLLSLCPWGGADILPPNSANTAKSPPPQG